MPTSEPTVGRIGALARRLVGTNAAIAAVCLAAIGLMWIAVIAQARFERREAVAAAIERNSNLAVAFEEFIVRTIDGADAVARYVKREYARTGAGIDIPGLIADRTVDAGAFAAISIVDERGNLVATSYGRVPGGPLNAADRPHFTVHVAGDTGKVFVGQPIMSRLTGKSTIPISRRINKPDGSFGGIVSVQIEPTRFTEFYGDATLRPGDVIALIGLDGIIRARRVGRQVSSGESLASGRLMTEQQAHPSGAYLAPGRFDSIPRYYSYRTLRDYPLLVTVGVAEQDVLLPSSQRRARNFVGTGLISGVMAFFAALLITALERKKRTVVMLKQTMDDLNAVHGRLAEQASLLDKAQDAIVVRDLAHRITYWNKSAERLYGWTAAEILGTRARDLQTDVAVFDEAMRKVVEHGDWVGELSQTRKGGHPIIVESRWTLVKDEAGRAAAVLVINTDITERRKLEHQFLRAQRLESIGTLAGGIAHDLNNVLTPIMVAIGLLREKEDDPARLDILSTLETSAHRGADMVRQVLSFARGVQGRRVQVQVGDVLRDVERIVNDTFLPRRSLERVRRSRPAAPGLPQPLRERARRDAARRHPYPLGCERDPGRLVHDGEHRREGGAARDGARAGQRQRHYPGRHRSHFRALLHHQGREQGHGARPLDVARHRQEPRRVHPGRERAGGGRGVLGLSPRAGDVAPGFGAAAEGRAGARPRRADPRRGR